MRCTGDWQELVEPLDGEREMGAALRPGDGVHLVEDQRLDRPQHLARLRREDEEERLGRRDEDVRRLARHLLALLLRRVARAHGNAQLRAQPGQRSAEVALDVVVQRFERRHVEQAQAFPGLRVEPVDAVEERRERLPRAGRRLDEDVPALGDGRPAERLGRRRLGERALEPGPSLVSEEVERAHEPRLAPAERANKCSVASLSRMAPDRLYFTGNDEADRLLAEEPLALLIGFALDQQVSVPVAFSGPLKMKQRLGTLDAEAIAGLDPEQLEEAFREKPAIHRFPGSMAGRVQELSRTVVSEYGGDAARVWTEAKDADDLRRRIGDLPGFGKMKITALGSVLAKRYGLPQAQELVPNYPDARRRRLSRGARALPGCEARVQGRAESRSQRLTRCR